jgi:hypothetical protein
MLPMFVLFGHKHYQREIAGFVVNLQAVWPAFWAKVAEDNLVVDGFACFTLSNLVCAGIVLVMRSL